MIITSSGAIYRIWRFQRTAEEIPESDVCVEHLPFKKDVTGAIMPAAKLVGNKGKRIEMLDVPVLPTSSETRVPAVATARKARETITNPDQPSRHLALTPAPRNIEYLVGTIDKVSGYLMIIIRAYCKEHSTRDLPIAKGRWAHTIDTTSSGRPASFRVRDTGESLEAGRFKYGSGQIIIVKANTWNRGKAVIAAFHSNCFSSTSLWSVWDGTEDLGLPCIERIAIAAVDETVTSNVDVSQVQLRTDPQDVLAVTARRSNARDQQSGDILSTSRKRPGVADEAHTKRQKRADGDVVIKLEAAPRIKPPVQKTQTATAQKSAKSQCLQLHLTDHQGVVLRSRLFDLKLPLGLLWANAESAGLAKPDITYILYTDVLDTRGQPCTLVMGDESD